MGRDRDSTKTDFSSFMCVILMLTGALVTIMIANITIISANPDNIRITSVMGMTEFADGNESKQPNYIDVHRDRMHLFFDRGERKETVYLSDLELKGNALEIFLSEVYAKRDTEYIVMLIRPFAANTSRRLMRLISTYGSDATGIDLGMELFDSEQEVFFAGGMVAEKAEE